MAPKQAPGDIGDLVATVELRRSPENYFDVVLIRALADAYESLGAHPRCRAIVPVLGGRALLCRRGLLRSFGRSPADLWGGGGPHRIRR